MLRSQPHVATLEPSWNHEQSRANSCFVAAFGWDAGVSPWRAVSQQRTSPDHDVATSRFWLAAGVKLRDDTVSLGGDCTGVSAACACGWERRDAVLNDDNDAIWGPYQLALPSPGPPNAGILCFARLVCPGGASYGSLRLLLPCTTTTPMS